MKTTILFLFISIAAQSQVITGDNQVIKMVNNKDSIIFSDTLSEGTTLITNHNEVANTDVFELKNDNDFLSFYEKYNYELDSLPSIGEWLDINKYYIYDTLVIKCLQSHYRMTFLPEETPALFLFRTPDVCADFVQPAGAHDAYNIGDCVIYNSVEFISLIDANVWSPEAYPQGWELK